MISVEVNERGGGGAHWITILHSKITCLCLFLLLFCMEQTLVERLLNDVKQKRHEVDSMSKELEEIQSSILQQLVVSIIT